jgi:hypothetical protein
MTARAGWAISEYQLHLVAIVHQPLLDFLQAVRLLADVDKVAQHDRLSLEQPDRALAAWQAVWSQTLSFRMGSVPGDHVPGNALRLPLVVPG